MEAVPLENTEETEETNQEQIEHMSEEDIVLPAPKKEEDPRGALEKRKLLKRKHTSWMCLLRVMRSSLERIS